MSSTHSKSAARRTNKRLVAFITQAKRGRLSSINKSLLHVEICTAHLIKRLGLCRPPNEGCRWFTGRLMRYDLPVSRIRALIRWWHVSLSRFEIREARLLSRWDLMVSDRIGWESIVWTSDLCLLQETVFFSTNQQYPAVSSWNFDHLHGHEIRIKMA